jgi:hypothetical protein
MGCCNEKGYEAISNLSSEEKDFSFLSYESYEDDNLEKLDNEYNILHSISLLDFLFNLENFDPQNINNPFISNNKTNYNYLDKFLNEKISNENFINFIENKFFMKNDINEMFPEKVKNTFKKISNDVYNKFNVLINRNVLKKDLIPLGLLFCKSSNLGKVKIFYDINSSPNFEKNENLFNFLKNMFILSILTENFLLINVGEKHFNIDNNEILTIAENLSNKFLNDFFKNKNVLTNEEYLKKFKIKTNEFGWIFNPNGIKKSINKDEKFAFKMFNNLNALENDLKGVKNDLNDILKDDYLEDSNENNNKEIKNEDFYLVHDSTNAIFEFDADFNENETENKNINNNNNINNEDFYLEHDSTNGLYDLEA